MRIKHIILKIFCFLLLMSCSKEDKIDLYNILNQYCNTSKPTESCEINLGKDLPFLWDELYILSLINYPEIYKKRDIRKYINETYNGGGRDFEEQLIVFFYRGKYVGEYKGEKAYLLDDDPARYKIAFIENENFQNPILKTDSNFKISKDKVIIYLTPQ